MGKRELREELASETGFAGQATVMIGRQWKLEDAVISGLVEEKKAHSAATQAMLKTRFDKTSDIVIELAKAVQEFPDDDLLKQRLDTHTGNLKRIEALWATSLGYTPQQVLSESEVIFGIVDQMSKDPGEFAQKGAWNKSTLELINRQFKDAGLDLPDPDVAEALWEFRAKQYKGTGLPDQAGVGGSNLLSRYSMAGIAAEVLGTVPDFLSEAWSGASELSRAAWEGTAPELGGADPYYWGDRTSREFLRKAFGVESDVQRTERLDQEPLGLLGDDTTDRIVPTHKRVPMGPFAVLDKIPDMQKFRGRGGGMIDTATQFMADTLIPEAAADTSVIGSQATEELQAMDEEATGALTDEAIAFLQLLQQFISQYGRERAIELLSDEWSELKDADRRSIEKYLRQ